jgi:hypothetical protein
VSSCRQAKRSPTRRRPGARPARPGPLPPRRTAGRLLEGDATMWFSPRSGKRRCRSRSRDAGRSRPPAAPTRPQLEVPEDRAAPAILTVNSLVDAVSGTTAALDLREAILLVDSGRTATDGAGNSLSTAKAGQIDTGNGGFGSNDTIQFDQSRFGSAQRTTVVAVATNRRLRGRPGGAPSAPSAAGTTTRWPGRRSDRAGAGGVPEGKRLQPLLRGDSLHRWNCPRGPGVRPAGRIGSREDCP